MNIMQKNKIQRFALFIAMLAMMTVVAGCDRAEQTVGSAPSVGQPAASQQPLGHVEEFENYTVRANVSRTDSLPDAMARKYGIEPESNLFLLNVVILESRADGEPVSVSAEVSAKHESLIGHSEAIHMRTVEQGGYVSYIGTLNASAQQVFRFGIEAQPAGTDQPLQINFELRLDTFEIDGVE